jgi:hypothetical protein
MDSNVLVTTLSTCLSVIDRGAPVGPRSSSPRIGSLLDGSDASLSNIKALLREGVGYKNLRHVLLKT